MKKKLKTQLFSRNYEVTPHRKIKGESMTIQNETLTIQQIVARSVNMGTWPYTDIGDRAYMDEEDIQNIGKFHGLGLDLTDLAELKSKVSKLKSTVDTALKTAEKNKAEEARLADIKKEAEKLNKSQQKQEAE